MRAEQTPSPFKGLFPYDATAEDARLFFGRDAEQEVVRANLMAFRLTVFYGPTGVGKSSILNAGVAHPLRMQARQQLQEGELPDFCVVTFRGWRENPARELVGCVLDTLAQELGPTPPGTGKRPEELISPDDSLTEALDKLTTGLGIDLLIILDQFEEYFIYHPQGAGEFDAEFARAVKDRALRVNFLISIREEWVAKLDHFKGPLPSFFENNLRLKHLERPAAAAAISEPMRVFRERSGAGGQHVGIPEEVVKEVLDDLQKHGSSLGPGDAGLGGASRGAAPQQPASPLIQASYLQLLMQELWEEQRERDGSHVLQLKTLEELGGVEGVTRNFVAKKMEKLSAGEQDVAASIFRFLVTSSGTKYAQPIQTLAHWSDSDAETLAPVLDKLGDEQFNLLRRTEPRGGDNPFYELVHDMLAPAIEDWASDHNLNLKLERLRNEEQQRRKEEQQREKAKRLRLGLIVMAFVCLALVATTGFAVQQRAEALRLGTAEASERARAEENFQKARRLGESEAEQRRLAEKSLGESIVLREAARKAQEKAEEQRLIAVRQRELAEVQEAEARAAEGREKAERTRAETAERQARLKAEVEEASRSGLSEIRLGRIVNAVQSFKRAETLYARQGDRLGQAASVAYIGDANAAQAGIPSLSYLNALLERDDFGGPSPLTGDAVSQFLQSFVPEIGKKLTKTQKDELSAARSEAISQYQHALDIYGADNTQESASARASVLRRLGDIYFFASLYEDPDDKESKNRREANEEKGIEYYMQAADDHLKAKEFGDRGQALRLVAEYNTAKSGPERPGEAAKRIERITSLYTEAAAAYEAAGQPLKVASVYFSLGEFHRGLPEAGHDEKAAAHFKQAYDILAGERRNGDMARVASALGRVYQSMRRHNDALRSYEWALEAYLRAGASREKADEGAVQVGDLKVVVDGMLASADVADAEPGLFERSLTKVLKGNGQNTTVRAHLLDIISEVFARGCARDRAKPVSSPTPESMPKINHCGALVNFLALEADVWRALGDTTEEQRTLFESSQAYDRENNSAAAAAALDEAFRVRRRAAPPALPPGSDLPLREYVLNGAALYEKLGAYRKAAEAHSEVFDFYLRSSSRSGSVDRRIQHAATFMARNYLRLPDGAREAKATFERALAAADQADDTSTTIELLRAAGELYGALKDADRASFYLDQERALRLKDMRVNDLLDTLLLLSRFYAEAGEKAKGERYFNGLIQAARSAGSTVAEATAHHALASLYVSGSEPAKAVAEYERAGAVYALSANTIFLEPRAAEELVKIHEAAHDEKRVEEALRRLLELFDKPEASQEVRGSLVRLIKFYVQEGNGSKEESLVEELLDLHKKPDATAGVRASMKELIQFFRDPKDPNNVTERERRLIEKLLTLYEKDETDLDLQDYKDRLAKSAKTSP